MTSDQPMEHSSEKLDVNSELLDRLVDGELTPQERRELLRRLEGEPQGWRRCALAFLEAQALEEELPGLLGEALAGLSGSTAPSAAPAEAKSPQVPQPQPARREKAGGLKRQIPSALAVAASLLAALWLGSMWSPWHDRAADRPVDVATGGGARESAASRADRSGESARPSESLPGRGLAGLGQGSPGGLSFPLPGSGYRRSAPSAQGPWEAVTLAVDGGREAADHSIQLPARRRDRLDEQWLDSLPGAMPSSVVDALRHSGHEVRQQRQVLPLRMQDGRKLLVPIDDVEVKYRGTRGFQ